MSAKPYFLIDAGGTLVFPNQTYLKKIVRTLGMYLTDDQLYREYYQSIYEFDQHVLGNTIHHNNPWPEGYVYALLRRMGVTEPEACRMEVIVSKQCLRRSLWTFTFPWIIRTLKKLKQDGYRMSVLSNSDGRTEEIFCDLGLSHYFEFIFDSHRLKVEKPDPKIFMKVMEQLELSPKEMLFIGDIYTVDVLGANQANIGSIHLDPLGLYTNLPGVHLPDISHLQQWLVHFQFNYQDSALFPLRILNRSKRLYGKNHTDKTSMLRECDESGSQTSLEAV